ncbi:MAG: hypothetical protein Q8908_16165, partial [Bacteroidota bacterium]|nr:hypothetical protein [Bacteroidota bacterium]
PHYLTLGVSRGFSVLGFFFILADLLRNRNLFLFGKELKKITEMQCPPFCPSEMHGNTEIGDIAEIPRG